MKTGKVSGNVLKRSVLRQIHNGKDDIRNGAGIGEDCAIFAFREDTMLAACAQEAAVAVQADTGIAEIGNAGEKVPVITMGQLVQKCVNNLATKGAFPVAAMITLLLPTEAPEALLKELMADADKACGRWNMQIVGGHTHVSPAVIWPHAGITVWGSMQERTPAASKGVKPGQDIVISKWIGLEGTSLLAKSYQEKLLNRYPAYLVKEAEGFDRYLSILPEAATAVKSGVCAMHDASEGGIFASLWELAEGAGVGLTIDMKKLPLRQETVEVCECLGLNPYELLSGGCLIMTSDDGPGLVAALKAEQIPAVIVGRITDSNDRIIRNDDEVRYMDRPGQDEIFKCNVEEI